MLAKVTNARGAYYGLIGDHHLDVTECHRRYGKLVRYAPDRLLIDSTQGLQDIYGYGKPLRKAQSYTPMVQGEDGFSTPTCIDKKMHRTMRDKLSHGLANDKVLALESRVREKIDRFVTLLVDKPTNWSQHSWSESRNVNSYVKWLTYDMIAEIGFGHQLGLLDGPGRRYLVGVFEWCTFRIGFYEQWPGLAKLGLENIAAYAMPGTSKIAKDFCIWRGDFMNSAMAGKTISSNGLFAQISEASNDGIAYSHSRLFAERSTLLIVGKAASQNISIQTDKANLCCNIGGDTTAATLVAFMFYLARSPHSYEKLAAEIRNTFPSLDSARSGPELSSCQYLEACIQETFRISPAGPGTLWRETERDGTLVDGELLPRGIDVGTCIYTRHRDGDIFRDQAKFWPERWIPGVLPEEELTQAKAAMKPFSLGPRSCVGKSIAMLEITLTIARLMYACDFRIASGPLGKIGQGHAGARQGRRDVNEFQIETRFTAASHGPYLQFRVRGAD